jgi:hypothetical protein
MSKTPDVMRVALATQPMPPPARFNQWREGQYYPESNSGKIGIFEPPAYFCPFGKVGDKYKGKVIDSISVEASPTETRTLFGIDWPVWEWVITFKEESDGQDT